MLLVRMCSFRRGPHCFLSAGDGRTLRAHLAMLYPSTPSFLPLPFTFLSLNAHAQSELADKESSACTWLSLPSELDNSPISGPVCSRIKFQTLYLRIIHFYAEPHLRTWLYPAEDHLPKSWPVPKRKRGPFRIKFVTALF